MVEFENLISFIIQKRGREFVKQQSRWQVKHEHVPSSRKESDLIFIEDDWKTSIKKPPINFSLISFRLIFLVRRRRLRRRSCVFFFLIWFVCCFFYTWNDFFTLSTAQQQQHITTFFSLREHELSFSILGPVLVLAQFGHRQVWHSVIAERVASWSS